MTKSIGHQRLDKLLCQQLSINKKSLRIALARGEVNVDGEVTTDADTIVHRFSRITYQRQIVQKNQAIYLAMHKPQGVLSATKDDSQQTVIDLIRNSPELLLGSSQPMPANLIDELHIAGRLDKFSTGLLLLTNDSRFSERISFPEQKMAKRYRVTLENELTEEYIDAFEKGMYFEFEDITTQPAKLEIIAPNVADVELYEGRYHQIKRMFGRFRNPVIALHRYAIGDLILDETLPLGSFRQLSVQEVANFLPQRELASKNEK